MTWSIVRLETEADARACARLMACSEPWLLATRAGYMSGWATAS
jgi:hypothetical protein